MANASLPAGEPEVVGSGVGVHLISHEGVLSKRAFVHGILLCVLVSKSFETV